MRISFSSAIELLTLVMLCSLSVLTNASVHTNAWVPATATWYGDPHGDGSEGGACGYGTIVKQAPYLSEIAAGSPDIFKSGEGCGACYEVKCTSSPACSGKAVTVVITDECPGCGSRHFDLSGTAIDSLALTGRDAELRNVGIVSISAQRVSCEYVGRTIAFHVDPGANNYYLAVFIEFEDGAGDLGALEVQDANSNSWTEMSHIWGANWALNSGSPLEGPFSFRLTPLSGGRPLILKDAIPSNFQPGSTYTSTGNF